MSGEWGPGLVDISGGVVFHNEGRPLDLDAPPQEQPKDQAPQVPALPQAATPPLNVADFPSMRKFLTNPLPRGFVLKCVISRHKSGFFWQISFV